MAIGEKMRNECKVWADDLYLKSFMYVDITGKVEKE